MSSTIIRKKKKCVTCNTLQYIFSRGNCQACATVKSTNRRIEKYEEGIEAESWINLRDDLDAVYSKWLRISNSDAKGECSCFTCEKVYHYSQMDCGHFIPRDNNATRFLPQNTKPQCKTCNQYKDGNEEAFKKHLEQNENGIVQWLQEQGRSVSKPTVSDLKELLNEYRHKLKTAQSKFKK